MAYTPNEWSVGNLITASKMNKIERQLVANTSDLDDIRNGVTVPTYDEFEDLVNNTVHVNEAQTLTTAQKDQARDNIEAASEEDVTSLKSALSVVTQKIDLATNFTVSQDFISMVGSCSVIDNYIVDNISHTTYISYYLQVQKDADIWFPSTANYLSICTLENYYQTVTVGNEVRFLGANPHRYRTLDNNLPSVNSKLSVHKGDYIFITIANNNTTDINIYGLEYEFDYSTKLQNDLKSKTCKVVYNNTVVGYETERLYVYLPTKNGYIRVNFCHAIDNAERYYNIWLIHPLYFCNNSLVSQFAITTDGEFECALKVLGASDFMGGTAHGDEMFSEVYFFLDNALVDADDLATITDFTELRVVVKSSLYDADTHGILTAYHAKEYIFNKDGITINQTVTWTRNVELTTSYLAMFPVVKSLSPKIITNKEYRVRVFATDGNFNEMGTTKAISFRDDFNTTFEITKWDIAGTNLTDVGKFLVTDNTLDGSGLYNKQYFFCVQSGNVASGDIWRTTTRYAFEA